VRSAGLLLEHFEAQSKGRTPESASIVSDILHPVSETVE
jgi:hypothetical protein